MSKYFKTRVGSLESAVLEAVSPAQQAAIAISKKEKGEEPKEEKVECPKCKGEGCDHCDGKGYHMTEGFTPKEIKMAIGVASDKRYAGGNMTGATKAIDKIKKGLSDHPQVAAVLKRQNEVKETNKNDKSDDGEGLDAVQPKAVKKKFADRKDKDIDNDGDVDSSDKFLHKRRKAVSKSMQEQVASAMRSMWGEAAKKMDGADDTPAYLSGKGKVKSEEDDSEEDGKKTNKTMTGKPLSKIEVSVKEKD